MYNQGTFLGQEFTYMYVFSGMLITGIHSKFSYYNEHSLYVYDSRSTGCSYCMEENMCAPDGVGL